MSTEELDAKFPLANAELRPFLGFFPGFDLTVPPAEGVRPFLATFPPPPMPDPAVVSVANHEIPGKVGQAPLRLLVVRPVGTEKVPVILAFHGGGFIFGVPELDLPLYSNFATQGFAVISPDYRLAPEHPFPAAYDDSEIVYDYLTSQVGQDALHIDGSRVGAYGSSAGSALATGLAIRLTQKGAGKALKIVVMDSTVGDDRLIYPSQAADHPNAAYHSVWTRTNSEAMRSMMFPDADAGVPLEAAPLRSTNPSDFKGLPPHFVTSCELDSLADQGEVYRARLESAGIDVQYKMWKGGMHAFQALAPTSAIGLEAANAYADAFKKYLA